MTLFYAAAAGLIAVAWWLLWPARQQRRAAGPLDPPAAADRGNLAILKAQLAELDAELAAGTLGADQHRSSRAQIERRVLDESTTDQASATATTTATATGNPEGRQTTALLGLGVCSSLLAAGLYGLLGTPAAIGAGGDAGAAVVANDAGGQDSPVSPAEVDAMLAEMEKRLDGRPAQPGDAQGWTLVARSHAALQRFEAASKAYARAIELAPNDAQLLTDQADVLAMLQGRTTVGEPARLIARALEIDPNNLKALALAGTAALEAKDFATAAAHWQKAVALAPAGSDFAKGLEQNLAEVRALGTDGAATGGTATTAGKAPTGSPASSASPAVATATGPAARITGRVSIAPALAGRVAATDTLFIFARPVQGPRMPLAVLRRPADKATVEFTLDDSLAMSPESRLSTQSQVVVSARVSRSGSATPQSGDLQGQVRTVGTSTGEDVLIVIDSVVP